VTGEVRRFERWSRSQALAPLALVLVNACAITERRVDERAEPDASSTAAAPEVGGSAGGSAVEPQLEPEPEPEVEPQLTPCEPGALFTSQRLVEGLAPPGSQAEHLWLSSDELEAYFIVVTETKRTLWHAGRALRRLAFSGGSVLAFPQELNAFDLAVSDDGQSLVADVRPSAGPRVGFEHRIVELTLPPSADSAPRLVATNALEPWLSRDARRLYFIGGVGSLWVSSRQASADFSLAREVFGSGAFGSSAQGRGGPVLTADELALYYSEPFDGQTDIYLASRATTQDPFVYAGAFGSLNSDTENESPDWLSPDGCRLYFEHRALDGSDVQIFMASK
jgi:hypothetical protein